MHDSNKLKQDFVELSSALTDFNAFSLHGTGQVDNYLQALMQIIGNENVSRLLTEFNRILSQSDLDEQQFVWSMRKDILGDLRLGPIARNIMKLWYTGKWCQLPLSWRQVYGENANDTDHYINAAAYTEGLLWKAIDAPPSGAKGPGFGSWQSPPELNSNNGWKLKQIG